MDMVGDVKCYHCGHISGQVEGTKESREAKLTLTTFNPRPGYNGSKYKAGHQLRCERCEGPVFLEDLRKKPVEILPTVMPAAAKQPKRSRGKAA